MKTYEYKHFNSKLSESEMNKLGEKGWKLVSHTAVAVDGGFLGGSGFGQYYVFMREKPEETQFMGPK